VARVTFSLAIADAEDQEIEPEIDRNLCCRPPLHLPTAADRTAVVALPM
jgi:hypothetical protein